jgi:hypothetical protein
MDWRRGAGKRKKDGKRGTGNRENGRWKLEEERGIEKGRKGKK